MLEFYEKTMDLLAIPMHRIRPYSIEHLEIAAIVVVAAILVAFLFAKTGASRAGVIATFSVVLLLFEILKQCLLTHVRGSYGWSDFPWQLCSIPLYVTLAYPHMKKGRDTADVFLMTFGFLGGAAALIVPESSFYPYLLLTIQSLVWHGILLMLSLYLMMSCAKSRSVQAFRPAAVWYLLAAVIAIVINFVTKDISRGASNMFFLGPNYPHMYILNAIYKAYGWIVESVAMILATLAAAFVVYFVSGVGKRK